MSAGNQNRSKAPVFVAGCPRSGTTLLYDTLLSAGGFAVYLTESNVFGLLAQRFGDLSTIQNRQRLMTAWLGSKLFRASGLDAPQIEQKIVSECRNYGDFLRITMDEIARSQDAARWADNTPEHILYASMIKALIPEAVFIHMIRDGRAVALSLDRRSDRGLRVLPWDRKNNLLIQGVYWEWFVRRGQAHKGTFGPDYMELRFEDLVDKSQPSLDVVGRFIDQKLSLERIREVGYRTVREPNTSFPNETGFDPIRRWREAYSQEQLGMFEALMGDLLGELGYSLLSAPRPSPPPRFRWLKSFYLAYFSSRFWFKTSALGKTLRPPLTGPELDEIVMGEDRAPVLLRPTAPKPET